ncbi:MAG TPA: glycoside hydrolase N-terminal domain-containing protein [Bacteroidales bacterium]|nr:glycoside hydrolase N-terminal domain-containing protein [Bacteroidales bacterium]
MAKQFIYSLFILIVTSCISERGRNKFLPPGDTNLRFTELSKSWDEAIPLGNGMIGALIWQKEGKLRFSLDRADLWDLRPMENLDKPEWKFSWVQDQWKKDSYQNVQKMFDEPYDRNPAPSKIPGGAIEFNISSFGKVVSAELDLETALCEVRWDSGITLQTFVNAGKTTGWFRFKGLKSNLIFDLLPPVYTIPGDTAEDNSHSGQDLRLLGYPAGEMWAELNHVMYIQEGWGEFKYQISLRFKEEKGTTDGCWSISSEFPGWEKQIAAADQTSASMKVGFNKELVAHKEWWCNYWSKSAISIPDPVLMKQWYLEMYKLGAATGNGAPPISLQAIWTADNGKLPPWKGDFHHDLNTQLSYWPSYSSNHLEQEKGFVDWLQKNRPEFEKYTREYYQTAGLNVPGVTTLAGKPMGGWIQYSFGPTVSAWLGHHFYLHWRYTMDREFLENEAYPWLRDVAGYLDELSVTDKNGLKRLPLSSSPEIFNNSRNAWFDQTTNFDLGLIRWTFENASELASELGKTDEATKWKKILDQWPEYDIDPETGFTFIKGIPYNESHRHFSHLIAFHPLGNVDWSKGEEDRKIIKSTIDNLDRIGPDWWCGYSYSWLGNIKARAFDGSGAAEALRTFAQCFCLKNSFHANGDQTKSGKSKFVYRPFTLEGNFAFASGLQEMLLQSHTGIVKIFPAIPEEWSNSSFSKLRAEGAFLVSAKMDDGKVSRIEIVSEAGGEIKISNPYGDGGFISDTPYELKDDVLIINTTTGQKITLKNK